MLPLLTACAGAAGRLVPRHGIFLGRRDGHGRRRKLAGSRTSGQRPRRRLAWIMTTPSFARAAGIGAVQRDAGRRLRRTAVDAIARSRPRQISRRDGSLSPVASSTATNSSRFNTDSSSPARGDQALGERARTPRGARSRQARRQAPNGEAIVEGVAGTAHSADHRIALAERS